MAFGGIMFVFYEDHPKLTIAGDKIYGKVISSAIDAVIASTVNLAIPGNCTYISIFSDAIVYSLIGVGNQTVTQATKADLIPATTRTDFAVGPLENTISYKTA